MSNAFIITAIAIWLVLQVKILRWQNDLDTAVTELLKLHPELLWDEEEEG